MFDTIRKSALAVGAFAALALGGSAIAGAASSSSTTAAPSASTMKADPAGPAHGTPAHENAEKAVTGDAATKAQAAAVKSVGSGTAGDVVNDMTGTGFETTVTKADGSKVEVHLDSSYAVMQGHGPGGDRDGDGR